MTPETPRRYLSIDVLAIVMGSHSATEHARDLIARHFQGDTEAFRAHFGLSVGGPVMQAIDNTKGA